MKLKLDSTKLYIKSKDYTLTNEEFELHYNSKFDLLFTNPKPKNLEKYYDSNDYISHTDSSKTLVDKLYQYVKNYTLKNKLKLINSFNTNQKKILDIGAGTGDFINVCKNNSWNTTGIEPSKKARATASTKNLVLKESIADLGEEKFDIITMWHVLEHVPNLNEYIVKLKKLLTRDGVLIIAVPNYKSYDAKYYKEHWAAYDVPRHLWHFSKTSIERLFALVDMYVEKRIPMIFDSFYVSLLSEKYKKNQMKLFRAFYIGLVSNLKAKQSKEYSSLIYIIKNTKN